MRGLERGAGRRVEPAKLEDAMDEAGGVMPAWSGGKKPPAVEAMVEAGVVLVFRMGAFVLRGGWLGVRAWSGQCLGFCDRAMSDLGV